jgi:hypothetical protein
MTTGRGGTECFRVSRALVDQAEQVSVRHADGLNRKPFRPENGLFLSEKFTLFTNISQISCKQRKTPYFVVTTGAPTGNSVFSLHGPPALALYPQVIHTFFSHVSQKP